MSKNNKKALLVGINYTSIPQIRLRGCINDIVNMSEVLMDSFDYDRSNIIKLRDDTKDPRFLPTKANILNNLTNLVNESSKLSEIWFHYSGHGSKVRTINSTEIDGIDEVIVPIDYRKAGLIIDNDIFNIIKNSKCPTILLFDSCHSGSVCDLQYSFDFTENTFKRSIVENKIISNPNIFCFSGCKDHQTSADSYNPDQQLGVGAFTDAFIYSLRENHYNVDIMKLYSDTCNYVKSSGYSQIPNLSCSTSEPIYTFVRTNNNLFRTNIFSIQDVSPTPTNTPRLSVPMNTPKKNLEIFKMNITSLETLSTPSSFPEFRVSASSSTKPLLQIGKMF